MCGICGIIQTGNVDHPVLERMTSRLRHRGPDYQNAMIINENVGLGHARLSIIDLSTSANQPLSNEDDTIWLSYNGEFYTYMDYKDDLIAKGHIFKTNTDSEVIIHLYEEYGLNFVDFLHGMFAIALYDKINKRTILVRDRVGKKPLYYHYSNSNLIFASEIKAILEYPGITKELDIKSLNEFFMFGYISGSGSIYSSVRKLPAAHMLVFENNEINISKYWDLPSNIIAFSEGEAKNKLDKLLNEAIKMRMISDVPLGVLLSGGVDSSLVAAIMAKHSDEPVKTFSISFKEEKYNEVAYARKVAKHIGSDHHEFTVDIENTDIINDLIYFYDEPFADSSAVPTYFVSKLARDYVTVVLSGDGGDELFGGYNWYDWMYKKESFNFLPLSVRKCISSLSVINKTNYPGRHFLSILAKNEFDAYVDRTALFTKYELNYLLGSDAQYNFISDYNDLYNSGKSLLQRLTRTDFNHYLVDDVLTKVDRASMAVSLEVRVPLLDQKICEFAFSLKDDLKIKGKLRKYLLKEIAKRYLPEDFDYHRKQGFTLPQAEWLKGKYGDIILELIENNIYLNHDYVKKLVIEHKSGLRNNSKKLWPVLIFLLWNNFK